MFGLVNTDYRNVFSFLSCSKTPCTPVVSRTANDPLVIACANAASSVVSVINPGCESSHWSVFLLQNIFNRNHKLKQ